MFIQSRESPPASRFSVRPLETPLFRAVPLSSRDGRGDVLRCDIERWSDMQGQRIVRNVVEPCIVPILPLPARATGRAVLIAPGGGYLFLSMDNEGMLPAVRLARAGIAAFVLKYRLKTTSSDDAVFSREADAAMTGAVEAGAAGPEIHYAAAVDDAAAAMRIMRAHAGLWNIDPARIGAIGFSAGAITLRELLERNEPATTPDNVGLIYGPMAPLALSGVPPPLFAAMAADDEIFGGRGFGLVEAWHKAGAHCEFHCYERGGHGFGMPPRGLTSDLWFEQYLAWLQQH